MRSTSTKHFEKQPSTSSKTRAKQAVPQPLNLQSTSGGNLSQNLLSATQRYMAANPPHGSSTLNKVAADEALAHLKQHYVSCGVNYNQSLLFPGNNGTSSQTNNGSTSNRKSTLTKAPGVKMNGSQVISAPIQPPNA